MIPTTRFALLAAVCASLAVPAVQAQGAGMPPLKRNPKCEVPFPTQALQNAPAGFQGETLALLSFNIRGEFRSARLLRSSGNETLDSAALRAAVGARCESLGDPTDEQLKNAEIGIPYAFTFDTTQGSAPARTLPVP